MAAGGVRENPELFSCTEAPIGVHRGGAGTKVLATPQAAARSAVRSVPETVIILPVALPDHGDATAHLVQQDLEQTFQLS